MASVSRVTQTELATRLGLSTRQIRNLEKAGMPKESDSGKPHYPWPAALQWYIEFRIRSLEPEDLAKAELRKAAADARLAEIKVAREEGQLVPIDDTVKSVERLLAGVRSQMLTFPQRVAPTLVGCKSILDVQTRLEAAIQEVMSQLSAA